jgi:predicted ester cyclase
MRNRSEVVDVIHQFFETMNTNDVSALPFAEDVEYRGSLMPNPIFGVLEVRKHLEQIAPFVLKLKVEEIVIEDNCAAAITSFEAVNGVRFTASHFLRIKDGKISKVQSIFDSHPLFNGPKKP